MYGKVRAVGSDVEEIYSLNPHSPRSLLDSIQRQKFDGYITFLVRRHRLI